jgi:hypothetical protein
VIGSRGSPVEVVIEWQNNLESFYLVERRARVWCRLSRG